MCPNLSLVELLQGTEKKDEITFVLVSMSLIMMIVMIIKVTIIGYLSSVSMLGKN